RSAVSSWLLPSVGALQVVKPGPRLGPPLDSRPSTRRAMALSTPRARAPGGSRFTPTAVRGMASKAAGQPPPVLLLAPTHDREAAAPCADVSLPCSGPGQTPNGRCRTRPIGQLQLPPARRQACGVNSSKPRRLPCETTHVPDF